MAQGGRTAMTQTVLTGSVLLTLAVPARAQEPPPFRKGLWEFTRTVEGTATCVLPNGKITSKQILTAQDDTAYTVKIDSSGVVGGQTVATKEELIAKRLGDCP